MGVSREHGPYLGHKGQFNLSQLGTVGNVTGEYACHQHSETYPFKCPECGRGYMTKSGLHLHRESHRGKKYACPVCDLKFGQKGNARRHLRSHGCAQCTNCDGIFTLGSVYDKHVYHCHTHKRNK